MHRHARPKPRLRRFLFIVANVVIASACREPTRPRQMASSGGDSASIRASQARLHMLEMTVATSQGRCIGIPGLPAGCVVSYAMTPAGAFCGRTGSCNYQMDPITATFSKPVYQLVVFLGGAMSCDGTYGSVTVYNIQGRQVEQSDMVLSDTSDCGYDRVTNGSVDTLRFPGGIASVTIAPPQPGVFIVHDTIPPDTTTGRLEGTPGFEFYEQRPPTVDSCLTGDELLDQQAMRNFLTDEWNNYAHINDVPSNRREVRGWLFEDSTGTLVQGIFPDTTAVFPDTLMDTPCMSVGVPTGLLPGLG